MRPFYCPQCGYKNYITTDDVEGERSMLADRATERLKRKLEEPLTWRRVLADIFFGLR